jgi:hypothetical protein
MYKASEGEKEIGREFSLKIRANFYDKNMTKQFVAYLDFFIILPALFLYNLFHIHYFQIQ